MSLTFSTFGENRQESELRKHLSETDVSFPKTVLAYNPTLICFLFYKVVLSKLKEVRSHTHIHIFFLLIKICTFLFKKTQHAPLQ